MLYIIMPAYNEEKVIAETIEQWHQVVERTGINSRLVIFNDGSTDNTYDVMLRSKEKYPQFMPIDKPNSGHGPTCTFAYNFCINSGAEFIFQTDSDGQTCPADFWQLWERRNRYDFLLGYRKVRKDGLARIIVSWFLKIIVWLIYGENVKDPNTPFRLMNADKLLPILKLIPHDFFLSNVLISMLIVKRNEKALWMPITFRTRQKGVNSLNLSRIIKVGFTSIWDFHRIKKKIWSQIN